MMSTPRDTQLADASVGDERAKRAFLAHMRHGLRTPINAIIGYSELMIEALGADGGVMAQDLRRIVTSGNQLAALVDDALDPRKLAAQKSLDVDAYGAQLRHSLRTPLTSIVGYAELLLDETTDAGFTRDLGLVHQAATKMLGDIQDLVALTEIGRSRVVLDLSGEDSGAQIMGVMSSIRSLADDADDAATVRGSIIIVDDDDLSRELLRRQLERSGHTVASFASGVDALQRIETEDFDLALVDVVMPIMNGYQVLGALRGNERTREFPVIMLSSLDEIDTAVRCIEQGADDCLSRPIHRVVLKARIESCLERKRLRDLQLAAMRALEAEQRESERLLLNILPREVATRLKSSRGVIADSFPQATVLFADLVDFTRFTQTVSPGDLLHFLNSIFSRFDALADHYGLEKIKTIGDAYMVVGGVPTPRADHAHAILNMATAMMNAMADVAAETGRRLDLRIGVNSGPVIAGVIGIRKFIYDLWGDSVNTASRMESSGLPGAIHVSAATRGLVGDAFSFQPRGIVHVKGKGDMETYFLIPDGSAPPQAERDSQT